MAMKKNKAQPKPPIPAALKQKLDSSSNRNVEQRNAHAPRGGHSPRAIRHQGR